MADFPPRYEGTAGIAAGLVSASRTPELEHRPPLPQDVVERIRRERYAPRITQGDYLHLADVRRALARAFASLDLAGGPALDLFCGAKPYSEMIPARPVWGLDIDRHFARADVVARGSIPFANGAFSLVLCTQALHMADDPAAMVREMRRVLAPHGAAVVTVPWLLRLQHPAERRLSRNDLESLFRGWEAEVRPLAGVGVGLASYPGTLMMGAVRRWPAIRPLMPPAAIALNAAGAVLEALTRPLSSHWPSGWIVVARRPDD